MRGRFRLATLAFVVSIGVACAPAAPAPAPTSAPPAPTTAPAAAPTSAPAAAAAPTTAPSAVAKPAATGAPTAAAAAKPSQPLTTLTVSFSNISPSELAIWIAKDAGIFEKNGLDVNVQYIAGGQVLMSSLVAGEVPIGQVGGSEVLSAAAGGADIVCIGVLVPVSPWAMWVAPEIKTADDLKGKKIAIVTAGGSADIAARIGLPKVGIDPDKDVTFVATGNTQNQTAAMLSGQVEGGTTHPPETTPLKAKGWHVLFDLAAMKMPSADTTITVQRKFMTANHDVVQRYVDSVVEAIAREKSDRAFALSTLKKWMKSNDDAAMQESYDYYSVAIRPNLPAPSADMFNEALDALKKKNPNLENFDVNKIVDASFVKSAGDRGLDKLKQ